MICTCVTSLYSARPTPAPEKIRNKSESILNTFEHYTNTMLWLDDVLYSSLYTAAFPPVINQRTVRALEYYENYQGTGVQAVAVRGGGQT